MASHHSKSLYAIKECSTCGSLYTKECCSIGSFEDKILTPVPDSSPRCARCGTPVDGPSCHGCAFLRKEFEEDLLAYCVENGIFQDFQNTSESSDDNTNIVNSLQEPCVVNQDPGEKSSQDPPQIDHNCCYECGDSLDGIFCQQCICKSCGKGAHYGYNCPPKDPIISKPEPCNQAINEIPQTLPSLDPSCYSLPHVSKPNFVDNPPNFSYPPPQPQFETYLSYYEPNSSYDSSRFNQPQPPQDSVDHQGILQVLNKMEEKLKEIIRDRRKKIEYMSIEEMMHEQQLVDREIKEIINDLGYKRFQGEEIDEEYERDCKFRVHKLKQDFNIWGVEVRRKEQAYEEEKYSAAHRYMLSTICDDDDEYSIQTQEYLKKFSSKEPDNSLSMGDEQLDTIPATESDEVIKSSVEILVPIPSEFEGISDDTSYVLYYDRVNVESDLVESLINRDTSIVHSSKIDPILEEFAGKLAHITPISPELVEVDFDPNDDTSSDDDSFENIEYVDASPSYIEYDSFEEVNDVEQEEKEFDLEDIFQIQDVILREKIIKHTSSYF
ncbi:hypothetical protein Tco_1079035 [Tanacetum coccineum]|uniref:CCHC-type domain-containing protein n=1 Tax=Tanacetum coccineum TaxID=301880 RepID=A0ABQ5HQQ5_9ASTR